MFKTIRNLWRLGRSLENPQTKLSDPDDWLWDAAGAKESKSGVRVNTTTALTYSPVWRAVNLISRDVAKLPLFVYERTGAGKTRATKHAAYKLLRRTPNPAMSAFHLKQTMMAQALLGGNAYAYIFRRGDATPEEVVPLNPDKTNAVRVNGKLWYETTAAGMQRFLPAEDVIHIRGMSVDGLIGLNTTAKAKDSFGLGMAAEEFNSVYFANAAEPSVVFEHPKKLGTVEANNLRASWNAKHRGIEHAHKVAVLEEGMQVKQIGADARKAQLLELRKFQILDVANWFGVPPHKLGHDGRTSYSSLEQENQSYLDDALDPWLVCWEEECWSKLLTEQQKDDESHTVEFLRQALVRADLTARGNFYNQALQGGWMNRDEIRDRENLNPIPNGEGAEFYIPLNMATTGQEPSTDTQPAEPTEPTNDGSSDNGATIPQRDSRKRKAGSTRKPRGA